MEYKEIKRICKLYYFSQLKVVNLFGKILMNPNRLSYKYFTSYLSNVTKSMFFCIKCLKLSRFVLQCKYKIRLKH